MAEFSEFEQRWQSLQQHLTVRVAALYIGASWVILQGVSMFGVSIYALRSLGVVLIRVGDKEDIELDESFRIARGLHAGSVLNGSAFAAGRSVKIIATLRSTAGALLAQAAVTGSADSVLVLADSLTLQLLREI